MDDSSNKSPSPLEDFDRRLRKRIARHEEEREQATQKVFGEAARRAEPFPDFSGMPVEKAIADYDEWVTTRIEAHRRKGPAQIPAPPEPEAPGPPVVGQIAPVRSLPEVDQVMVQDFALDRFLSGGASPPPTVYCTTMEEFVEPVTAYLGLPSPMRDGWLQAARRERPGWERANPLGRVALYIPSQGCYVNGWRLARLHDLPDPRTALTEPAAFRDAVRQVAGEKWGLGFIRRRTEYGVEREQHGLYRWDLAERLGVKVDGDTTRARQAAQLRVIASFTEAGWTRWVSDYLAQRADPSAGDTGVHTDIRLAQLWDAAEHLVRIVPLDEVVGGLLDAIRWLFLESEAGPTLIHKGVRVFQSLQEHKQADQVLMAVARMPVRTLLGRLLMGKLEARLGMLSLPYAMLIAGNLTYDLEHSPPHQIEQRATQYPRQNVDTRLAMLGFLDPVVKHNVSTMVSAARHEFELEPPPTLQWA